MTHQQSGVVKALIPFSRRFNLATISAPVGFAASAKLEVVDAVNTVLPAALTYENTFDVV